MGPCTGRRTLLCAPQHPLDLLLEPLQKSTFMDAVSRTRQCHAHSGGVVFLAREHHRVSGLLVLLCPPLTALTMRCKLCHPASLMTNRRAHWRWDPTCCGHCCRPLGRHNTDSSGPQRSNLGKQPILGLLIDDAGNSSRFTCSMAMQLCVAEAKHSLLLTVVAVMCRVCR